MEKSKAQILFAPKVKALDKLGVNWYDVVMDITEYLTTHGFSYKRAMGFISDEELSEEEMLQIGREVAKIGHGPKYFHYLRVQEIGEITDLTYLFKNKENEE